MYAISQASADMNGHLGESCSSFAFFSTIAFALQFD